VTYGTNGACQARVVGSRSAAGALSAVIPGCGARRGARRDGLSTGDVVELQGTEGEALGQGIWDEDIPIAARIYTRDTASKARRVAHRERVERAILPGPRSPRRETTAYRLLPRRRDRVPGVVIDRYDTVAVVRLDGAAIATWLPRLANPLGKLLERSVSARLRTAPPIEAPRRSSNRSSARHRPRRWRFAKNGVVMVVDLAHGRNRPFLDQRDKRARVRELSAGRRVLNLFSYAGGFSTAAALAARPTSPRSTSPSGASRRRRLDAPRTASTRGAMPFVTRTPLHSSKPRKQGQRWDLV